MSHEPSGRDVDGSDGTADPATCGGVDPTSCGRGDRAPDGTADPATDGGVDAASRHARRVSEPARLALFAREDVRDGFRERQAQLLGGLFGLVGAGLAYAAGRSAARAPAPESIELAPQLLGPLVLLVPLVALGFVAPGLVEKRANGGLAVLLGLPFARRTVILGTFLGRCLLVVSATLLAAVVALPIGMMMGTAVDPGQFGGMVIALALLAVTFVAIAVAISAVSQTSTRATVAAFGAYVVFVFDVWAQLPLAVLYVRHGFSMPATAPGWTEFVAALNPVTSFSNLLAGLWPSLADAVLFSTPENPALYERPAVAAAIMVGWIVVAVGAAIHRFRATDL